MRTTFSVRLQKQSLIFSAAHFITFGENICERLHGHNYRVECDVFGNVNSHGYVIDFIALRDALREIAESLDHRVLLPTNHPTIRVSQTGPEVIATFEDRRWVFPIGDCCLLPIDNTTAERLAEYIGKRIWPLAVEQVPGLERLSVAVDENEGQWGRAEFRRH